VSLAHGALLDALRGATWPARHAARGASTGSHRSVLRGTSPEFTEYRAYRQGDDPRRIDWRLLARTDRAHLRITSDHSTLGTVIVVDASASMAFPTATRAKWEQACRIAVGLAAVAHASGDPVGLIAVGDGAPRSVPPRTRRGVAADIARLLTALVPNGTMPLAPAVAPLPARTRVAIVTDFLGDADALLVAARARLRAGGDVCAVHLVARLELEPPGSTMLAFDPEAPRTVRPLGADTRDDYARAFAEWRARLGRDWREIGAGFTEVLDDEPAGHAVRRVIAPAASGVGR
jgi:uncharacterized protein (DUF58 family)